MKFDQKKLINGAKATGLAVAGFAGAHAASKLAPAEVSKYVPYGMLAAGVLLPAVVKSPAINSLAIGLGSYGAIKSISGFIKNEDGSVPTEGVKAMIAEYVPQLSGYSLGSLGNTYEYNEDTVPLLGTSNYETEEERKVMPLI